MNLQIDLQPSTHKRALLGFMMLALATSARADHVGHAIATSGAATNQAAAVDLPVAGPLNEAVDIAEGKASDSQAGPSSEAHPVNAPRSLHRRSALRVSDEAAGTATPPWYRSSLGALAIVLAIIGALFIAVKRFLPTKRLTGGDGSMVIASRTPIDTKHNLALVRVGQRFLVIGISPDRLDALCEISDVGEVAGLAAQTGVALTGAEDGFRRALDEASDKYQDGEVAAGKNKKVGIGSVSPRALRDLVGRVSNLHVTD